jgi:hypothetical protein
MTMQKTKSSVQVRVWFVLCGLPGCLPNSASAYATKASALEGALWEVRNFRDAGYRVTGSKADQWWDINSGEYIEVTDEYVNLEPEQSLDEWLELYNSAG